MHTDHSDSSPSAWLLLPLACLHHWFPIANAAVLVVLARWCWPVVEQLYFWERVDARQRHLDHWSYAEQKNEVQALAWRKLARYIMRAGLVLAYLHVYSDHCNVLLARRTAARSQPPPYGCGVDGAPSWEQLGMAQQARITLGMGPSQETECATYLEHVSASVWANPFIGTPLLVNSADAMGQALSSFLGRQSLLLQVVLVALMMATLVAGVYIAPLACASWLARSRTSKKTKQRNQTHRALRIDALADLPRCQLVDADCKTPVHIP